MEPVLNITNSWKNAYTDMSALRRAFSDATRSAGPILYLPVTAPSDGGSITALRHEVATAAHDGYAGVIPYYPSESPNRPLTADSLAALSAVAEEAAKHGLCCAYLDDQTVMSSFLAKYPDVAEEMQCRILRRYEYACMEGDTVSRPLGDTGTLLSLVAVEADTAEILDLRAYITADNRLAWTVPEGNWVIHRYVCERDPDAPQIHMMNYGICRRYFDTTCAPLLATLSEAARTSMQMMICRNIQYGGKNRRMWSEDFNRFFTKKYGFDPAPFYPCLFERCGAESDHYRSLMMECRADMLAEGYLKAAADFADEYGMALSGYAIESKATGCSWLFGDGMKLHRYSALPGISMPFAYLYGLNGIKVAAGASDMREDGLLSADMFRRYPELQEHLLYKETLNALSRGVNLILSHAEDPDEKNAAATPLASLPVLGDWLYRHREDYTDFCTRAQLLLRGGRHVSDIAVLYPIHAVHADTYLYDISESGFEYPATPEDADYMTVMNNLLTHAGRDAAFIHPDDLTEDCLSEDGRLYLRRDGSGPSFRVVIVPGGEIISLRVLRILADFFEAGGCILASGTLPRRALEVEMPCDTLGRESFTYDEEVRLLCRRIFGEDTANPNLFRASYVNRSAGGGVACFLPSTGTAADGTAMVPASVLTEALHEFAPAPDVYMTDAPAIELSGIAGYTLPTFLRAGAAEKLAKIGSVTYLHRKNALCDIYFLANTTDQPYTGEVLLRGIHTLEEWNPYRGKTRRATAETVRYAGEIYTCVSVEIPASHGTFLISPNPETSLSLPTPDDIREYTSERKK